MSITRVLAGSLTTLFEGTHGWYWKNYNSHPVTITLNVKGEYKRLDLNVDNQKVKNTQVPKTVSAGPIKFGERRQFHQPNIFTHRLHFGSHVSKPI